MRQRAFAALLAATTTVSSFCFGVAGAAAGMSATETIFTMEATPVKFGPGAVADAGWELFDQLAGESGHTLPLLVFVDGSDRIAWRVQRRRLVRHKARCRITSSYRVLRIAPGSASSRRMYAR